MWCAAFGRPVDEVFSSLSVEPVASASLGQVYKGRLRDMYGGGEVAVKVQRPHVQASVALDLLLMRRFAAFSQTFPQVCVKSLLCTGACSVNNTLTAAVMMATAWSLGVVLLCAHQAVHVTAWPCLLLQHLQNVVLFLCCCC